MTFANFLKGAGKGVMLTGAVLLAAMAVIGTMAIDIVLLAALLSGENDKSPGKFFFLCTALLFRAFRPSPGPLQAVMLLTFSPITTAIAIGLAFYFSVPMVGIGLAAGWGGALGILALGAAIYGIGRLIENYSAKNNNSPTVPGNPQIPPPAYPYNFQEAPAPGVYPSGGYSQPAPSAPPFTSASNQFNEPPPAYTP